MAVLVLDPQTLARIHFSVSPLVEVVAALSILLRPDTLPWHSKWRQSQQPRFDEYLRDHPVQAALAAHALSASWAADFLTFPPSIPRDRKTGSPVTFEDEVAALAGLDDATVRADLRQVRTPLSGVLESAGLAGHLVELLRWVWEETVAPDWSRRQRTLKADVVSRTHVMATSGWAKVFDDLSNGAQWLGDGRLQYDSRPFPDITVTDGLVTLHPAHCRGGWIMWPRNRSGRFGIVYPVAGIFADTHTSVPESLAALLGTTRARVLSNTITPGSTSSLAGRLDLPLATVGAHLRVLLDAGLVHRRRSGREVLYWTSDAGTAVVAASRP